MSSSGLNFSLDNFVAHLGKLRFVEAEKLLRSELAPNTITITIRTGEKADLLTVLNQLVSAESQYFTFSYLASKFSFRKENSLREAYTQIRSELTESEKGRLGNEVRPPLAELTDKFARFAGIRASLVEFYALLPAKEWRAFDSDCFRYLMLKMNTLPEDDPLSALCRRELEVLKLFLGIQQALQDCNAMDSLILLSRSRCLLDEWFRSLDPQQSLVSPSARSSALPSFLSAFSSSRRRSSFSRLGLLQFLLAFHTLLVAKCSLYFHDTLVAHAPGGEVKQAFSAPNSFFQLFQTFARKSNAHTICLLVNRIDQDAPFYGFGYHYDASSPRQQRDEQELHKQQENRTDKIPSLLSVQPASGCIKRPQQSGLFEKYPALLFLPPERRVTTTTTTTSNTSIGNTTGSGISTRITASHMGCRGSEYATICAFVQEGCSGTTGGPVTVGTLGTSGGGSSSNDKLLESGKIRYLYDRNKDQTFFTACVEANIHLVVTFERRVQERESALHSFFNDALNGLRGTKLFQQEIRTFGK